MFIINPDPYNCPVFRISPFRTADVAQNHDFADGSDATTYFNKRFGENNWQYTYNGREAINLALQSYGLRKDDLVTVVTTSQNFYISSCVTNEIELFCRWNREILPETKVIFVNHEFGFPYPEMEKLVATGLPIIEDCCTTFFSQDANREIGRYGDFSLYSFPKFFPLQIGGLLVSNADKALVTSKLLDAPQIKYIENVLSYYLPTVTDLLEKRKENYEYAISLFSKFGFTARFNSNNDIVPSALLLNNNAIVKDLNTLKNFLYVQGIQNSVFYGEDAFFIPSHQNLEQHDIEYFAFCFEEYLKSQTL
jgi:DegT/DnrJ/EryC1/StrS aminotransferase family protein